MTTDIYTISELPAVIASEKYHTCGNIPVSPERVSSYTTNPRSDPDMPVLFTLTDREKIVAYRTLLPDIFHGKEGPVSFAWLSGNFVDPAYRRQGLSTKLFRTVEEAWEGRLMYTNYAPASRAVYDKSGVFSAFLVRPGNRYYLRSALYPLLKERVRIPGLLKTGDRILNGVHDLFIQGRNYPLKGGIGVEEISGLDATLSKLISESVEGSLFARGPREFDWIRQHPWVTGGAAKPLPGSYQFTRQADPYLSQWYKLSSDTGTAFLWITVVGDKCSVPYYFTNDIRLTLAARQIVFNTMIRHQCSHITIRHPELGPALGTKGHPFLLSRKMPQRYFAHAALTEKIPPDPVVFDGDGDCVFS
jgi:GNAT superfamily N-acetyltransferase